MKHTKKRTKNSYKRLLVNRKKQEKKNVKRSIKRKKYKIHSGTRTHRSHEMPRVSLSRLISDMRPEDKPPTIIKNPTTDKDDNLQVIMLPTEEIRKSRKLLPLFQRARTRSLIQQEKNAAPRKPNVSQDIFTKRFWTGPLSFNSNDNQKVWSVNTYYELVGQYIKKDGMPDEKIPYLWMSKKAIKILVIDLYEVIKLIATIQKNADNYNHDDVEDALREVSRLFQVKKREALMGLDEFEIIVKKHIEDTKEKLKDNTEKYKQHKEDIMYAQAYEVLIESTKNELLTLKSILPQIRVVKASLRVKGDYTKIDVESILSFIEFILELNVHDGLYDGDEDFRFRS